MNRYLLPLGLSLLLAACASDDDARGAAGEHAGEPSGRAFSGQGGASVSLPSGASGDAGSSTTAASNGGSHQGSGASTGPVSSASNGAASRGGPTGSSLPPPQTTSPSPAATGGNSINITQTSGGQSCTSSGPISINIGLGINGFGPNTCNGQTPSTAQLIEEERNVGLFDSVELTDGLHGVLFTGPQRVSVNVNQDLSARVKTTVRGTSLEIGDGDATQHFPTSADAQVLVGAPLLRAVTALEGASFTGAVSANTLALSAPAAGNLDLTLQVSRSTTVDLAGTSSLKLSGASSTLVIRAEGTGELDTSGLRAEDVEVIASGVVEVVVLATSSVKVTASGASSVTVRGNPAVRNVAAESAANVSFAP
jgi:hypothetical protein